MQKSVFRFFWFTKMEVIQDSKNTSITIQVDQNQDRQITDGGGSRGSMFSPTDQVDVDNNSEESNPIDRAPEKRLTLFALRLAVLEKAASGLGTLGFVWATVVLLGGFAITLDKMDFWVITVILVIEGARIFSRSHELEWQHQSTRSSSIYSQRHSLRELESTCNELRTSFSNVHGIVAAKVRRRETQPCSHDDDNHHNLVQRRWKSTEVPLLPYNTGWFSLSSNISRVLYWLQLLSAIACVTLSLIRLIKQDYGELSKGDSDKRNRKAALNIFYSLALAEALLFLSEKGYWEWKVRVCNLLDQVNDACGFRQTDIVPIKRFFYDAFSRCINGSIFDGLKMDMVSFSEELLGSDSYDEQLIGARILLKFATKKEFAIETLRKIGTSSTTMERLLEMLNWKNPIEEELRMAAAMVVLKLSGKKQNTLRVAGIPGSLESISSLLNSKPHANSHRNGVVPHQQGIDFPAFNLIGLRILKKLAHDHDNCSKIGNTRGLLQKIIDFTGDAKRLLRENHESSTETQIDTMKYALQVVKMLASTSGPTTGKVLRQEISEIVFTISSIRDILKYGENHMMLQQIAIEILRSLAMDEEARDKLGCTGGIMRELFVIFFKDALTDKQNSLRAEVGEALMMITLDNMENCKRILNLGFVDSLIQALNLQPSLMKNSARILRNMCAYIGAENLHHLRGIIAATPTVLKLVMEEEGRTLEVSIGLAVQMFRFLSLEEYMNAGIEERDLTKKLVDVLRKHSEPSYNLPRIRRFTIELAIAMMKLDKMNIRFFKEEGLKEELKNVADTTSELEFFLVFSGSAGLSRHHTTMYTLVEDALKIMENSSRCE